MDRGARDSDCASLIRDSIFLLGAASMAYGIYSIYPPAAWIFAGGAVAGIAYFTTPAEPVEHDE